MEPRNQLQKRLARFQERKEAKDELLLFEPEGPYSQPYFMSLVSEVRRGAIKSDMAQLACTPRREKPQQEAVVSLGSRKCCPRDA